MPSTTSPNYLEEHWCGGENAEATNSRWFLTPCLIVFFHKEKSTLIGDFCNFALLCKAPHNKPGTGGP
jgi:hypothetical protein